MDRPDLFPVQRQPEAEEELQGKFAPGQYNPGTSAGKKLLGHELTHVVQQAGGRVQPTGEVAGLPLNDSPALESEADRNAEKAV